MKVWIAKQYDDAKCYNLMERTKKALVEQIKENDHVRFVDMYQLDVDMSDGFRLIEYLTGEVGGRDEYMGSVKSHHKIVYRKEYPGEYLDPTFIRQEL